MSEISQNNQNKLEHFFSQHRLRGYKNLEEHETNLSLIASISHKIGILEIIIRNKIDILLCAKNVSWLEHLPSDLSFEGDLKTQSRDKIISSQSMGFWLKVADFHKIHNEIFSLEFLDNLDFKKYFEKNKSTFKTKHNRLLRHHKAKAILLLLRLMRNRAFHFENLYKIVGNGYPRLNIKISNKYDQHIYIAIYPTKIKEFLNDIIGSFDKDLVYCAESGGKCHLDRTKSIADKDNIKLK